MKAVWSRWSVMAGPFVVVSLLLSLLLSSPLVAEAADQTPPDAQTVRSQLETLEAIDNPDPATRVRIERLSDTAAALDELERARQEQQALETRVERADRDRRDFRDQLARLGDQPGLDSATLDNSSVEQLEQRLAETVSELADQQQQMGDVSRALISAQTLPERVQSTISDARRQQQRLRESLDAAADDEVRRLIETRLALQQARIELGQSQLANAGTLRDVSQLQRELLSRRIDINQNRLLVLQEALNQKRRTASEQTIAEVERSDGSDRADSPVVDQARSRNRELSQELLETTDRANTMIRNGIDIRARLEQVNQVQRSLNEQIEALRGSLLLSRVLRQQREALPAMSSFGSLQETIAALRLRQFEIDQMRDALSDPARYIDTTIATETPLDGESRTSLVRTLEARRDLLDQLDREYGNLVSRAIEVQLNQQQLVEVSATVRATIEEQLFWVANGQPLGIGWLEQLPTALSARLHSGDWQRAALSLWRLPSPAALLAVPVVLLALAIALLRPRIKAALLRLHQQIGHLRRDTQRHTPRAIVLNLVLSATGPLLLLALGSALRLGYTGFAHALGVALLQLALAWAVFALMRRLTVPDGVAVRHFHWPADWAARLRRDLLGLGAAVAPVVLVTSLAEGAGTRLADQPLALLLLSAGLLAMTVFMLRLVFSHVSALGVRLFRLMLGVTLAMVPLVMVGLIVFGYEYTALRLTGRFIVTLYILALWLLVEASVVRGLAVAARRLAYRRAVARRRAQNREGAAESGVELVEEPPLDMEQVNQQSLRLSRLMLFLGLVAVLYLVWADLLGVLSYLDSVRLGGGEAGVAGEAAVGAISLADVIAALATLGLMVIMARNLPGLLEVMVLSRLSLKQGSAYAITSLLSYTIVGGGFVVALATLGVSWDKLQWLVAALSVGLGFGLQEIFANFISGLIILFERPIRIGDTITLGHLHGTVSRIRIRATTVTDFDRKEIIIPNKTFVTDQLINWSLSDSITRVVLTFGVAHGADLNLAHRLLRRIADEHPKVLAEPEPQVFCMTYSQNAFDFELRVFVNELVDRLTVTDEINRRVDAEFRDHGLRVAFQQMDVWLHDEGGQQRLVERRGESGAPQRGEGDDGWPWPHAPAAHDGEPGSDAAPER